MLTRVYCTPLNDRAACARLLSDAEELFKEGAVAARDPMLTLHLETLRQAAGMSDAEQAPTRKGQSKTSADTMPPPSLSPKRATDRGAA